MNRLLLFCMLVAGMLLSAGVHAGDIQIENVWARATAPGQDVAGVDMDITSKHAAKLVGVHSPAAGAIELHSMIHESGTMKMREVKTIELPAGQRVNLGESGYHLMLIGLKSQLKEGVRVPLTLSIKVGNKPAIQIKTMVEVTPLTAAR